jgi:ABC-type transport system involved in multi-copper enzyme maturation permease subunit
LRSPNAAKWRRLFGKERRELASSRAWIVLLLVLGPLVGHAFITAVDSYAEASGSGGGPAALAQGLSPLDGIIVPTFGAYAIAVTLLFPFVAIRLVSSEKQNGSLKLLLQSPASLGTMLVVKLMLLVVAWVVAWVPGIAALVLWHFYGGHLAAPELAGVLLGHVLRATLICSLAIAAASFTDNAATAAVVTLAVTLGTWALDFIAQVRGGLALMLDAYTPESALRTFETGEIRVAIVLVTVTLSIACLLLGIIWLHPGRRLRTRVATSAMVVVAASLLVWLAAQPRTSWDVSEDHRNSFSPADERALSSIPAPLHVTVYLAPEDPRLADLERGVLRKLGRTLPRVDVDYAATGRGSSGLFARPGEHYGEVWYAINGRQAMTRSTTEQIVLETVYGVAGITPPTNDPEAAYSGYPLVARPVAAAIIFYLIWPCLVVGIWLLTRRTPQLPAPKKAGRG